MTQPLAEGTSGKENPYVCVMLDPQQVSWLRDMTLVMGGGPRTPPDDFGDIESQGLSLKRRGTKPTTADVHRDYGYYLGHRTCGWVVAHKGLMGETTTGESYASLDALKKVWELD